MHTKRLTIILFVLFSDLCFAECDFDPQLLGARYTISSTGVDGKNKNTDLTIWRKQSQVLWEYPQSKLVESWYQNVKGQLQLTRYFDGYNRGIEYHPADFTSNDSRSWERLWGVVTSGELAALESGENDRDDCRSQQRYSGKIDGIESSGKWLVAAGLPTTWVIRHDGKTIQWDLKELVTDGQVVANAFAKREDYQLTDYADIGDNESDPFFLKMMNLGHVTRKPQDSHKMTAGHQH